MPTSYMGVSPYLLQMSNRQNVSGYPWVEPYSHTVRTFEYFIPVKYRHRWQHNTFIQVTIKGYSPKVITVKHTKVPLTVHVV